MTERRAPATIPIAAIHHLAWLRGVELPAPEKDRSHWVVRRFSSFDEQRRQQVLDWQALSGAERRKAAWELVTEYWIDKKGMNPDELRLQRSVAHLRRGGC